MDNDPIEIMLTSCNADEKALKDMNDIYMQFPYDERGDYTKEDLWAEKEFNSKIASIIYINDNNETKPIAFCTLDGFTNNDCPTWVNARVGVLPEYRNKGYGSKCLQEVIYHTYEIPIKYQPWIVYCCKEDNFISKQFAEKNGFKLFKHSKFDQPIYMGENKKREWFLYYPKSDGSELTEDDLHRLRLNDINESANLTNIIDISFPAEEIDALKKQNKIITTRVSSEYNKYHIGDLVRTPWGDIFKVLNIKKFREIENHPYLYELTEDQIKLLGKYKKMDLITMYKQKNIDESYEDDGINTVLSSLTNKEREFTLGNQTFEKPVIFKHIITDNNKPIGFIRLLTKRIFDGDVFVQFAIDPKYRGKGYAKELINTAKKYVKTNKNIKNLYYNADIDNIISQKFAEKSGYTLLNTDDKKKTYLIESNISEGKYLKWILDPSFDLQPTEEQQKEVEEILNNTPLDKIFLSTDWHIFKPFDNGESNLVDYKNMIRWCQFNIRSTDVFIYLGDLSYRKASIEEQHKVQKIFRLIPGHKILIIGNHDFGKEDFYMNCGFDYVFDELIWKNLIFTHAPLNPPKGMLNIHGHIHDLLNYYDAWQPGIYGKHHLNVYPTMFGDKPVTLKYLLEHQLELIKSHYYQVTESNISEGWRADLPDSSFGIPEDRKFPLDTESRVRSAIHLFGHAAEDKKKSLARRINNAAKKYGIKIPETTQVYKYLHESSDNTDESGIAAMNTVNPVVGGGGNYILRIQEPEDIYSKLVYSIDPSSGKGLIVNENNKLEIIDVDESSIINKFKFIGNEAYIDRLINSYNNNESVESLYNILTDKHQYTEDQIDFDSNFKLINEDFDIERHNTKLATFIEEANIISGNIPYNVNSLLEMPVELNELHTLFPDIIMKEDVNGYYLYDNLSHKRTRSVSEANLINKNMFNSLLTE